MVDLDREKAEKFYNAIKNVTDQQLKLIASFDSRFSTKYEHNRLLLQLINLSKEYMCEKKEDYLLQIRNLAKDINHGIVPKFFSIIEQEANLEQKALYGEKQEETLEINERNFLILRYKRIYEQIQQGILGPAEKEKLKNILNSVAEILDAEKNTAGIDEHITELLKNLENITEKEKEMLKDEIKALNIMEKIDKNTNPLNIQNTINLLRNAVVSLNGLLVKEKNNFFDPFRKFMGEKVDYQKRIKNMIENRKNNNMKITIDDIKNDLRAFSSKPEEISSYVSYLNQFIFKNPAETMQYFDPAALKYIQKLASRAAQVSELQKLMMQNVEQYAYFDALTKIANRRKYEQVVSELIEKSKNNSKFKFSFCMVDIDKFRDFNNYFGHPAGDAVLGFISSVIKNSIGNDNFVARYGGEEFVCLFPNLKKQDAFRIMENTRINVQRESAVFLKNKGINMESITISGGIATFPDDGQDEKTIYKNADSALYKAKETGRNKIVLFE